MTSNSQYSQPSFAKAPVVETVLGVQFDGLPNFTNAHLGAFWKELDDGWTKPEDAPPLRDQHERFGSDQMWSPLGQIAFEVSSGGSRARMQVRNSNSDRMIQLQNGRFHLNWLGHGGAPYSRHDEISREFFDHLKKLEAFAARYGLGEIKPNQWEVTYVNKIPKGTVWNSPADWPKVFSSDVCFPLKLHQAELENVGGEWHYQIASQRGRLHVEITSARELPISDGGEILIFKLTARGPVEPSAGWDLPSGIELGHEVIVKSFVMLTSDKARKFWEQEE
jgi:uncharacterized protein (TIGR04255 family)